MINIVWNLSVQSKSNWLRSSGQWQRVQYRTLPYRHLCMNQKPSIQSNLWHETTSLRDTIPVHISAAQHHKKHNIGGVWSSCQGRGMFTFYNFTGGLVLMNAPPLPLSLSLFSEFHLCQFSFSAGPPHGLCPITVLWLAPPRSHMIPHNNPTSAEEMLE